MSPFTGRDGTIFLSRQEIMNIIVPDKNNPPRGQAAGILRSEKNGNRARRK